MNKKWILICIFFLLASFSYGMLSGYYNLSSGSSGSAFIFSDYFNQYLNTTSNVTFNNISGSLDCSNVTGANYDVCTGDGDGINAIYS
jgi:hypothetical protein